MFDRLYNGSRRVRMDFARIRFQFVFFNPFRKPSLTMRFAVRPHCDRNIRTPNALQKFCNQFRAILRFSVFAIDEFHIQLWAAQQKAQGPGIVDIVTNVRA